jgi:hypothetical protein
MITATIVFDLTEEVALKVNVLAGVAVAESALEIGVFAQQEIMTGPKSGILYTTGPEPLPHRASAPGEAPANWTDELADSIHVEQIDELECDVIADAEYAISLEFGMARIEPRPFMLPAAEEGQKIVKKQFERAIEAATVI